MKTHTFGQTDALADLRMLFVDMLVVSKCTRHLPARFFAHKPYRLGS